MRFVRPVIASAAALGLAAWLAAPQVSARQAAPAPPADVAFLVNGHNLAMTWTQSTDPITGYVIDAGFAPGVPFVQFPTTGVVNPNTLPQLLASLNLAGAPNGSFYVAVRSANGAVLGPPSAEVNVNITNTCVAPGSPNNLTSIVRGSQAWLAWNPGNGGLPTTYILQASLFSGANFDSAIVAQGAIAAPTFNVNVPPGTYYVRIYAANACGASGFSNEISVTAGLNTPATTPNPATGRIPEFDFRAAIAQFEQQAVSRGLLPGSVSCPSRPGFPDSNIEARKVNLNPYINYLVDSLRTIDGRFGYNAKPTRAQIPAIVAGDEVAYHYGRDAFEQSPNVYLYDLLGGHCTFGNETPGYRPFYDEFGRATAAGRFVP